MTGTAFYITAIAFCLLCEAFFAGSEMGLVSINKIRLKHLANEGHRGAQMVARMLENPERLLGTTLVAVNLAIVASSSLASYVVSLHVKEAPELVATVIMLPLVVVFGELIPKMVFRRHADRLTLVSIYGLRAVYFLLFPIVALCSCIGKGFAVLVGAKGGEKSPYVTRDELQLIVREQVARGGSSKQQFEMAHQTFYFSETIAKSIMVPLIDVKALPVEATVREIRTFVKETGFSHVPIYEERIDQIVGLVESIDLLGAAETQTARNLMHEPLIVPDVISIDALLDRLKSRRVHLAVLIDEYGGVSGIATTEDVMEEIVGEILDEYDADEPKEVVVEKKTLLVDGKVPLDRLNEDHGLRLPKEGVETVGGFIISQLGAIPQAGQKLTYGRVEFEVIEATSRTVQRIRIHRK